jgi:DNA-3-methyladenine glycosylase I
LSAQDDKAIAGQARCAWADGHALLQEYHDTEWGVPVHDDRTHFEYLILDGAQAGLNWLIILKKREGYRAAFADFDPSRVAAYTDSDVERLMQDPGIIRNRAKIAGAIESARSFLKVQEEFGGFDPYVWQFTDGRTILNSRRSPADIPATSPQSDAMSKDLRSRGFKFVGSTICYAYMQAAGMVNDHTTDCSRYDACSP